MSFVGGLVELRGVRLMIFGLGALRCRCVVFLYTGGDFGWCFPWLLAFHVTCMFDIVFR